MRRNFGQDHGYGVGTIDGFRANAIGANNHSLVFDGCVSCKRSGRDNCTACRKSLQLRGTNWKVLLQDGASHSDAEMAAGTRVAVESEGYGTAVIDGFRHNMVGANNHSMVFEGCDSCARSGAKHCTRCRKSLQLRGARWRILPDLPQRAARALLRSLGPIELAKRRSVLSDATRTALQTLDYPPQRASAQENMKRFFARCGG